MHFSVFVPFAIAILLSCLSFKKGEAPTKSGIYRYPKAFSLVLMIATAAMFTVPLWPSIRFTPFQTLCMEGFFAVFFLIGVVIEFFRVRVGDMDIKQGFWPLKNKLLFADMTSIEVSERGRGGYVAVTMKNGKKFRFDSMLENFSYFCQDIIKKGRQNKVKVTVDTLS